MAELIFNEEPLLNGNIFKYEQRLKSQVNKYVENGAILTEYFAQKDDATTVDRGLQNIEQLFGSKSPLRFNRIENFPLYGFNQATPNNTDEQIEDINVEGDCIILPSTIVPKPMDFFRVNHLKMNAVFEVTDVAVDTMKTEGYYKIHYRLQSTSTETIENLMKQTVETYHTDLNAIGTNVNPIIKKDDFILRSKINRMVAVMIDNYKAIYYNPRHNCFIFDDNGTRYFDLCGNEFMRKHNLMNYDNSANVIMLSNKVIDSKLPQMYSQSIYRWFEQGCPNEDIQKFYYRITDSSAYIDSSFFRWGEEDIQIVKPIRLSGAYGADNIQLSYFNDKTFNALLDNRREPIASEYEKMIWKYINRKDSISIQDISLHLIDSLVNVYNSKDAFVFTPIIIYIIREILSMN
jgi:hypothetical protein